MTTLDPDTLAKVFVDGLGGSGENLVHFATAFAGAPGECKKMLDAWYEETGKGPVPEWMSEEHLAQAKAAGWQQLATRFGWQAFGHTSGTALPSPLSNGLFILIHRAQPQVRQMPCRSISMQPIMQTLPQEARLMWFTILILASGFWARALGRSSTTRLFAFSRSSRCSVQLH